MRAQYYISFDAGSNWSEFWPSNSPKLKLAKEANEVFKRWTIDKFRIARVKNATVYDQIAAMYFVSSNFGTDIKYKIKDLGTDKFYFIKPITGGVLDSQNCTYEVNPDLDDLYRPILQQYQKKWKNDTENLLFGIVQDFYTHKLNTSLFVNVDFTSFTDTAGDVTWSFGTIGTTQHARNQLIYNSNGYTVSVIITNYAGDPFKLHIVNASFAEISNEVSVTGNGVYEITQNAVTATAYVEMFIGSGTNILSGSYSYKIYYPSYHHSGGLLKSVITNIINGASFMGLAYTIKSTILWNDAVSTDAPTAISTYMTAHSTNDYVIEAAAIFNYLYLARTDTFTTDKEEKIEMSLKDLMDILKLKHHMWWFIDPDGCFRIEHEKYLNSYTSQVNLTSSTYLVDKPEVDQKIYNYSLNEAVSQVTYGETNEYNPDWKALNVNYDVLKTSENISEIKISQLSTDVGYIEANPDDASSSGICLLQCKLMGTSPICVIGTGIADSGYYENIKMSWYYLFPNYYQYLSEADDKDAGGTTYTSSSVKRFLKQNKINFRMSSSLLWYKPVTLSHGLGWIEDAEYDAESGMYSINVGFDPYE